MVTYTHTAPAERALHDQVNILPRRQLLVVFATLSATLLITFIDQNGISIALPTIAADLGAGETISWAGTSSLLANTAFQMLYGRLSDIFGRKTIFLTAVALLTVADLLCGLAQNPAMFYVFRGVAGIGGGGITNLAMIIVSDVVTLEQRGKYQGIIGAMVGLGNVGGPFLAAAIVERTGSWRAFFYMLTPLCAIAGIVSYFYLPDKPPPDSFKASVAKIDFAGSFTSTLGIIFILIPISGGGSYLEWKSPLVISMLTIGALSMVTFVLIEWKLAKLPMMPVSIFQNRVVVVMLIQSFLFGAVYQSYLYYIPLYLQNAHRFSVLESAAIYVSLVAFQTLLSVLSGQYISRRKRYGEVLWTGFSMWTLGAGLTLLYDRTSSRGVIIGPLILIGIGVGCIFQPTLVALQAWSAKSRRAVIISNRNFFRCAGGAVGLAVSAAVLQSTLRGHLPSHLSYLAESTYTLPSDLNLSATDMDSLLDSYMYASRAVFILQVPLIGLCLIGCLMIRDRGLEPIDDETSVKEKAEQSSNSDGSDFGTEPQESHFWERQDPTEARKSVSAA
ncbi:MFS general substrate transporter [Coniochaeta ligniaria NRRL 30616]|uniref:MFS general substrate transporter n=1 Tax=Coniochaeta ligniaria NRRL 30616 TaxID=1408157 RepID=A0A1J7I7E2_9PEZI|nr:MFS general substrate transporter [Coniochaeta ligniaria NRRL 30616]